MFRCMTVVIINIRAMATCRSQQRGHVGHEVRQRRTHEHTAKAANSQVDGVPASSKSSARCNVRRISCNPLRNFRWRVPEHFARSHGCPEQLHRAVFPSRAGAQSHAGRLNHRHLQFSLADCGFLAPAKHFSSLPISELVPGPFWLRVFQQRHPSTLALQHFSSV